MPGRSREGCISGLLPTHCARVCACLCPRPTLGSSSPARFYRQQVSLQDDLLQLYSDSDEEEDEDEEEEEEEEEKEGDEEEQRPEHPCEASEL